MFMSSRVSIIQPEAIERVIYLVRGQKVMLDTDLAELYGAETKVLNQAVRRNKERFPSDFMFTLSAVEADKLLEWRASNSSQIVTSSRKHRGRRYHYHAFTEQGVAMLSSVLRSPRAVKVNVEIMRAFVRLRQMLASNVELAQKLAALEKKYDKQFKVVFHAIRQLMAESVPAEQPLREIGFHTIKQKAPKNRALAN
jgi:hypothetical protein